MNFAEFERIISHKRMERYLAATANRKRRAMKLYNGNVCLAKETYVVINYIEVAMRRTYNNTYFFNELHHINILRNRIAHHEPICFSHQTRLVDTQYIRAQHRRILRLFNIMGIDSKKLLSGMDHVEEVCKEIETI